MKSRIAGKRVFQSLSDEERARHAEIRQRLEAEKPEILAKGRAIKAEYEARRIRLQETVAAIKEAREQQGLSLSETAIRSGVDKANLSKLENGVATGCTVDTLLRYAAAVGKDLVVTLVNRTA